LTLFHYSPSFISRVFLWQVRADPSVWLPGSDGVCGSGVHRPNDEIVGANVGLPAEMDRALAALFGAL